MVIKNKKVLVVLGGTSGERLVSLDSGKACIRALKILGYNVKDTSQRALIPILKGNDEKIQRILKNYDVLNGIPKPFKRAKASSSVFAVVTIDISNP